MYIPVTRMTVLFGDMVIHLVLFELLNSSRNRFD